MTTSFVTEHEHEVLVGRLAKDPQDILLAISATQMDLVHGVMGVCGESGELLDAIKKFAVYNKPLDIENVIEELGDIEFYLAMIRRTLSIQRETTLRHNITKLQKRYPAGYTDMAAQMRADKAASGLAQADPHAVMAAEMAAKIAAQADPAKIYHGPSCGYPHVPCTCDAG